MNRWNWTFTAISCAAAARIAVIAETVPLEEPTYKGKPVSHWVAALESNGSSGAQTKQVQAEEAIHVLGPEAIPFVLRYHDRNRNQRLALIQHACAILEPEADVNLLNALQSSDPIVRETAVEVLPKTLTAAALDDIMKLLADPVRSVRSAAIRALVRLAPDREETVAALIEALHESRPPAGPEELSRDDAALALGTLGAKAKAAVPELKGLLADPRDETREAAAVALWRIEQNTEVVPVLVERLETARDYQTCVRVMKVLSEMGPRAKAATPVILEKIEDPGVNFVPGTLNWTKTALEALAKIDPAAAAAAQKKLPEETQ